ncbi:MAG TPA: MBL fold metallo-hydrolase [Candidatus Limnocylindrales bacterium]|nr:MBL fold metallo-hydrolase [Candidatus Limnocylindrales bacterium]
MKKPAKFLMIFYIAFLGVLASAVFSQISSGPVPILKWLGTAGYEITFGDTVILIDPFLTRPPVNFFSKDFKGDEELTTNEALISEVIKKADYILVGHSHWDHLMDVPYIAKKTGARVIGSESTANILRSYDVSEEQIIPVKGGEQIKFSNFSVKVIPSLHSLNGKKRVGIPGVVSTPLKPPLKVADLKEGGTFGYYLRLGKYTILHIGSANFIENELRYLPSPDVAILGTLARENTEDYAYRIIKLLNPKVVIPTHWDNFLLPFSEGAKEIAELGESGKVENFVKEIKEVSPGTRVIVQKFLETYTVGKE